MEFPSFNCPSLPVCISSRLPSLPTVQGIKDSGRALIATIFNAMRHPIDGFMKPAGRTVTNNPKTALGLLVLIGTVAYAARKLTLNAKREKSETAEKPKTAGPSETAEQSTEPTGGASELESDQV